MAHSVIGAFIDRHNEKAKPYGWTKSADEILRQSNAPAKRPNRLYAPNFRFTWLDYHEAGSRKPEQAQTKYCIRQGASCDQPAGKVTIDAAYVVANTPIVREQLQKTGVRLAHLLDAALGK
jgi:hypothetical protein